MNQPLYIQSAVAISPQPTFDRQDFLQTVVSSDTGKLYVTEPDYRPFINPVAIRRMSRLMKMAISAAVQCVNEAEVMTPDGIITGTGRGSMTDTEHFLNDMIRLEEGAMNPTSFIQSTYNSPNGWIAMLLKCTAYNQTYVHRGSSLELALLDVQLILAEGGEETRNVLAGSYDELTDDYFLVKGKINYWKDVIPPSLELLQHTDTPGTIGGEGSAFFTFSNKPGKARAMVQDLTLIQEANDENVLHAVQEVINRASLNIGDIDLLLLGVNGDKNQHNYYLPVVEWFGDQATVAGFKHLCGEYDTATGFALWLCDWLIKNGAVPEILEISSYKKRVPRKILLVNHYILGSASVMLISEV